MLICFLCRTPCATSLKELFAHFKIKHWHIERYTQYTCAQGQCNRKFTDRYTFGRHIESQHADCISPLNAVVIQSAASGNMQHNDASNSCMDTDTSVDMASPVPDKVSFDLKKLAAKYIAEAKHKTSTLSNVNFMVKACGNLVECLMTDLISEVQSLSTICKSEDEFAKFSSLFEKMDRYSRPFEGLESEFLQKKHMEKEGLYVAPQSYVIGVTCSTAVDKKTGIMGPVMTNSTGQYISIRTMIETLHLKSDLIKLAVFERSKTPDGMLQTYFDGDCWHRHPAYNDGEPVIVLRLYGDDFEPGNPLGSHRTVYKLGSIYYQFEGLPQYMQSKTSNIFLCLCYHTDDVKAFGWESVLRPLTDELKELEKGIMLNFDGKLLHVKIVLGAMTGDNLFLNGILGFTESFTANFPCRQCCMHRENFQTAFVENKALVRTVETYNAAVCRSSVEETGIKFASPFNTLQYFHAATNFVGDIMHDVLEGVCKYDLILVINHLIDCKFVSREHLNGLVDNFSYGFHDVCNKPGALTDSSLRSDMLYFEAAQTWCFTRILSLVLGDIVPVDDEVWLFYLKLREIMDIIFAPMLSVDELRLLEVLISEYLEMHKTLFVENRLKNKHHHMTHYPRLIREFGPIVRYWCMRFESKHQRAKRLMHICGNFKNVPLTVATRHQYDVAYTLLSGVPCHMETTVGRGSVVCLCDLPNGEAINVCMGNVGMFFELYQSSSAEVAGIHFKPGCLLLIRNEPMPVFARLECILSREQSNYVWFVCSQMETVQFSCHHHAWKVNAPQHQSVCAVDPRSLVYSLPLSLHYLNDGIYVHGLHYRI